MQSLMTSAAAYPPEDNLLLTPAYPGVGQAYRQQQVVLVLTQRISCSPLEMQVTGIRLLV